MAVRKNLLELCEKIADGHYRIDENCAEYVCFEKWLTDDQIKVMMAMDLLQPTVAEACGFSSEKTQEILRELADIGAIAKVEKFGMEVYMLLVYAPGIFEFMLVNEKFCDEHPKTPVSFQRHATKSMENYA